MFNNDNDNDNDNDKKGIVFHRDIQHNIQHTLYYIDYSNTINLGHTFKDIQLRTYKQGHTFLEVSN